MMARPGNRATESTTSGWENPPSNNIWIGNVSPEVSESELKALFDKYGKVDSVTSYPSRSYAFLYFKDIDSAKAAKNALQGHMLRGSPLKIEFAKPAKPNKSLWVAGISQSVTKEQLEKEFLKFGKIQEFRFLRDRNTAYVDYVKLEDASQALKNMNGKQIGGGQIRVDYLRSHSSRREQVSDGREGPFPGRRGPPDLHWAGQDYSEPNHAGSKRHHYLSSGPGIGDGLPTKVLSISYPPSVIVNDDMLHNALILFGEVERIKTFADRNYALVQFRSAEEARRTKEGLQGKLFSDPRILIEYSSSELGTGQISELPFRPLQMDVIGPSGAVLPTNSHGHLPLSIHGPDSRLRPLGPHGTFEPLLPTPAFRDVSSIHKMREPNWSRSSPTPGLLPSPSAGLRPSVASASGGWDVFDSNQHQRESKRSRVDIAFPTNASLPLDRGDAHSGLGEKYRVPSLGSGGASGSVARVPLSGIGQRRPDSDFIWRGIIAKGGTPVCRARCVPIGDGIGSELPDVVNCSARTGLDLLTKHYEDAIGYDIVFFLPDSEEDFASYTEFLRYLGTKDRAGVAKFDDGTTLFLVPPSEFLTRVLKVSGPERLYGVVLKLRPPTPPGPSTTGLPLPPKYVHPQQIVSAQTGYGVMQQEERIQRVDDPRFLHEDLKVNPKMPALTMSNSFPAQPVLPPNSGVGSQPGVTLTPELIATLASLLPPNNASSGLENAYANSSVLRPQSNAPAVPDTGISHWKHQHQALEQTGNPVQQLAGHFNSEMHHMPQQQGVSVTSNMSNQFHQGAETYNLPHDRAMNMQSHDVSSKQMTSAMPLQGGHGAVVSPVNQQYQHGSSQAPLRGLDPGTDSMRFYSPSIQQPVYDVGLRNQGHVTGTSQAHGIMPASVVEPNQVHQLQSAESGKVQESAESEADKNERYKTTLLFAANLLSRLNQPPGNQSG